MCQFNKQNYVNINSGFYDQLWENAILNNIAPRRNNSTQTVADLVSTKILNELEITAVFFVLSRFYVITFLISGDFTISQRYTPSQCSCSPLQVTLVFNTFL